MRILTAILSQSWHLLTAFSFEIFVGFSCFLVCWVILHCILDILNIIMRVLFLLKSFGECWFVVTVLVFIGINLVRFRLQFFLAFQSQEGGSKANSFFKTFWILSQCAPCICHSGFGLDLGQLLYGSLLFKCSVIFFGCIACMQSLGISHDL